MRGVVPLGQKIVALRQAAGLTQEELAAASQCDVKTIRSAERSKRVDIATLRRIANQLTADYRDVVADHSFESETANMAPVQRWIDAFNARDVDALARCFDHDGSVIVLADPALPGSGEFRGHVQLREWARICFATYRAEQITPTMCQIDAVGSYVFVRVERPELRCLLNGNQSPVSVMWEFTIDKGRISRMRIYPESGAIERMVFATRSHSAS